MEFKIISKQKNPLLHRERYEIEIESNSSPSFDEIQKQLNKNPELIVIKNVQGKFGTKKFNAEIFIYDSIDAKKRIEIIPKKIKKKIQEEAKAKEVGTQKEEKAEPKTE